MKKKDERKKERITFFFCCCAKHSFEVFHFDVYVSTLDLSHIEYIGHGMKETCI